MQLTMPPAGLLFTMLITTMGIVDLWFVLIKGTGTSFSNFLVNAGLKDPMVVAAFMFLAGHLFGYMAPLNGPPDRGYLPTAIVSVLFFGFGYFFGRRSAQGGT